LFNDCQKITQRLKQNNQDNNDLRKEYKDNENFSLEKSKLLSKFDNFANYENTKDKQKRGYLLENLLISRMVLFS